MSDHLTMAVDSTPHHTQPLVIVGASLAGVRAAEGARAQGWTGPIIMIGDEPHLPYDRPPLSKALLDVGTAAELPVLRRSEGWEALDVELRTSTTATGVDVDARTLLTSSGPVGYHALVIATGHHARTIETLDGYDNVHALRHFDDALGVREILASATRLAVVGTGFIGSEIASAAVARGIDVTLIGTGPYPLAGSVGPLAGATLAGVHRDASVTLLSKSGLSDVLVRDNRIESVHTSCGREVPVDAVVVGIGSTPATAWLSTSALTLDPGTRGVVCDSGLATSAPAVWAAGDVAVVDGVTGGHWTSAAAQGFVAGTNAVGGRQEYSGVPFAWSSWHGHRIQIVGTTHIGDSGSVHESADDGVVLYRDGDEVVGAVGIDAPGPIAKIRRALSAELATTLRPTGLTT